jgi:hypothetical protein
VVIICLLALILEKPLANKPNITSKYKHSHQKVHEFKRNLETIVESEMASRGISRNLLKSEVQVKSAEDQLNDNRLKLSKTNAYVGPMRAELKKELDEAVSKNFKLAPLQPLTKTETVATIPLPDKAEFFTSNAEAIKRGPGSMASITWSEIGSSADDDMSDENDYDEDNSVSQSRDNVSGFEKQSSQNSFKGFKVSSPSLDRIGSPPQRQSPQASVQVGIDRLFSQNSLKQFNTAVGTSQELKQKFTPGDRSTFTIDEEFEISDIEDEDEPQAPSNKITRQESGASGQERKLSLDSLNEFDTSDVETENI